MNIILIGMPGCGKSTIGVLLAKALLMDFVDTDLLIQKECGKPLCDILADSGLETFKQIEGRVLSALHCDNCVIATGGSAVYSDEAMSHLKQNGVVVYLDLPVDEIVRRVQNITTRGIAMPTGCTLKQLYDERVPLYHRYADVIVNCADRCVEECVETVTNHIKT